MSTKPLIKYFKSYLPLEEGEVKLIEARVTERKIKRRQVILQEGFPCKHYSFVVEGCFRMYGVDNKGVEHNIEFAAESNRIAGIGSFHSGKPGKLFIEAIEPSLILKDTG